MISTNRNDHIIGEIGINILNARYFKAFSDIEESKLKGAFYYTNTLVDNARLVLRVLQESIAYGGQVVHYAKAVNPIKDENQPVTGIVIEDTSKSEIAGGESHEKIIRRDLFVY